MKVSPNLAGDIERLLRAGRGSRCSLANKAGLVVSGFSKVEAAIGRGGHRGGRACRRMRLRTGSASSGRRSRRRFGDRAKSVAIIAALEFGGIGFGIGTSTCDTCSASRTGPRAVPHWHASGRWSASATKRRTKRPTRTSHRPRRRPGKPQDKSGMSDTKNSGDKTLSVPSQDAEPEASGGAGRRTPELLPRTHQGRRRREGEASRHRPRRGKPEAAPAAAPAAPARPSPRPPRLPPRPAPPRRLRDPPRLRRPRPHRRRPDAPLPRSSRAAPPPAPTQQRPPAWCCAR